MNQFEYNYRTKHRFILLTNQFEYNYRAKHRFILLTNQFEYNYRAKQSIYTINESIIEQNNLFTL